MIFVKLIYRHFDIFIPTKNIRAPQISMNTTQIPQDTPQTPPRHLQRTQNFNRHQQTPTDANRHPQTPSNTDRCCLSKSGRLCWCLLPLVGILCSLEMSWGVWGMSGGYLGVSEWYSWKLEALRCVWG